MYSRRTVALLGLFGVMLAGPVYGQISGENVPRANSAEMAFVLAAVTTCAQAFPSTEQVTEIAKARNWKNTEVVPDNGVCIPKSGGELDAAPTRPQNTGFQSLNCSPM